MLCCRNKGKWSGENLVLEMGHGWIIHTDKRKDRVVLKEIEETVRAKGLNNH